MPDSALMRHEQLRSRVHDEGATLENAASELISLAGADREAQTIVKNKLRNHGQPNLQQSESDI